MYAGKIQRGSGMKTEVICKNDMCKYNVLNSDYTHRNCDRDYISVREDKKCMSFGTCILNPLSV